MDPLRRNFVYIAAALAISPALIAMVLDRGDPASTHDEATAAPAGEVLARGDYRGIPVEVTSPVFQAYTRQRAGRGPEALSADQRRLLLNEFVDLSVLAAAARHQGLTRDTGIAAQLEAQRVTELGRLMVGRHLSDSPVDEAAVEAAYEERSAGGGDTEYRARHILVEDEETALQLIEELDQGADFATLAQEHSTGPSGPEGGDLGWFTADRMVPPFSEAVEAMQDGAHSGEPVRTRFGWHVILREDSRTTPVASLEELSGEIRSELERGKLEDLVNGLREEADVEILLDAQD